jgi:leader peptidase (prepilin peptidase)/N-methyltransferase
LLPDWLVPVVIAPFVGSFLGVLIRRLPRGQDVVVARSRCESCGKTLGPLELVPVLSWTMQKGRCRACGAPLGFFHPAVELAALAIAVWAAATDEGVRLWAGCVLGWTLLALAWIDLEALILPDVLTLPLVLAGLAFVAVLEPDRVADHAAGAAIGWFLLWALARLYRSLRGRDGLGEGDAKLLAAAGAWVGWEGLGPILLIGALAGLALALARRLGGAATTATTAIPFGPPLALATWLVWLYLAPLR